MFFIQLGAQSGMQAAKQGGDAATIPNGAATGPLSKNGGNGAPKNGGGGGGGSGKNGDGGIEPYGPRGADAKKPCECGGAA